MANFANIANRLEGIINNEMPAARSHQGLWEWYNALARIMSANRFTGTPRVVGPKTSPDAGTATDVETNAVKLFGMLIDNSNSAEDVWLLGYDLATGDVTVGTSLTKIVVWVPRATIVPVLYPNGFDLTVSFSYHANTGTQAALEGTTGVTGTNPDVVFVYTE
jgi:hypothetical protein